MLGIRVMATSIGEGASRSPGVGAAAALWGLLLLFLVGGVACDRSRSRSFLPVVGAVSSARPEARVFVVDRLDGGVRILDGHELGTAGVTGPLELGAATGRIAFDPVSNRLWLSEPNADRVVVRDASTLETLASVATGAEPVAVFVDVARGQVFVANRSAATVSVFDADAPFAELPGSPVVVGDTPSDLAAIDGSIVVANFGSDTVSVFDALPPFDAAAGSPFVVDAGPVDLEVDPQDGLVFVACHLGDAVAIFDSPNALILPSVTGLGGPTQLARHPGRDLLYVANRTSGDLRVFTSEAAPVENADSPLSLGNGVEGVTVNAFLDTVFVSVAGVESLHALEAAPPFARQTAAPGISVGGQPGHLLRLEPVVTQTLLSPNGGSVFDVLLDGGRVYIAHGTTGLVILDSNNPRASYAQRFLGQVPVASGAAGLAVYDDYVFVGDSGSGVQVVDAVDPAAATIVRSVGGIGTAGELWRSGRSLFVDTGSGGLRILDVQAPALAFAVSGIDPGGGEGLDMDLGARLAYAAGGTELLVVDVRDPTLPTLVDALAIPVACQDVAAGSDRTAIVAAGVAGLRAVRINPTAGSRLADVVSVGEPVSRVFRSADLALGLGTSQRLHAIVARDPDHLTYLGSFQLPSPARRIRTVGRDLYVAAEAAGLLVIRFYP